MGAILREIGKGHLLTIDLEGARKKSPNIIDLIAATGFAWTVGEDILQTNWEVVRYR